MLGRDFLFERCQGLGLGGLALLLGLHQVFGLFAALRRQLRGLLLQLHLRRFERQRCRVVLVHCSLRVG